MNGWSPADVLFRAKNYLTMSDNTIEAEIYRYRMWPGQACSYKIGFEVIKNIIRKKYWSKFSLKRIDKVFVILSN